MSIRAVHLIVLCGLVALVVAVFASGGRRQFNAWSDDALLKYVPANAAVVLTADIDALRNSDLSALVPGGERELPGVGRLSSVCGFDPTVQVRAVAVALSAPSSRRSAGDELGVVAGGDFRADAIAGCARTVISRRQGRLNERRLGAFTLLSGVGEGILAMREHGPVLLGAESVLRDMIRASQKHVPDGVRVEPHLTLRRRIGTAPLVATWRPIAGAGGESGSLFDDFGPLSYATGAAVALRVEPTSSLEVLLSCDSLERCSALANTMNRAGRLLLTDVLRSPLSPRDIEVSVSNHEVRLRLALAARDFATLWSRLAERL